MMESIWQLGCLQDDAYPLTQNIKSVLFRRPLLVCSTSVILWYFLWYWVYAVRKPRVYCGDANLRDFFLAKCPALTECYRPTWWAVNCHICTIFRSLLQKSPNNIKYERYIIILEQLFTQLLFFNSPRTYNTSMLFGFMLITFHII